MPYTPPRRIDAIALIAFAGPEIIEQTTNALSSPPSAIRGAC